MDYSMVNSGVIWYVICCGKLANSQKQCHCAQKKWRLIWSDNTNTLHEHIHSHNQNNNVITWLEYTISYIHTLRCPQSNTNTKADLCIHTHTHGSHQTHYTYLCKNTNPESRSMCISGFLLCEFGICAMYLCPLQWFSACSVYSFCLFLHFISFAFSYLYVVGLVYLYWRMCSVNICCAFCLTLLSAIKLSKKTSLITIRLSRIV